MVLVWYFSNFALVIAWSSLVHPECSLALKTVKLRIPGAMHSAFDTLVVQSAHGMPYTEIVDGSFWTAGMRAVHLVIWKYTKWKLAPATLTQHAS